MADPATLAKLSELTTFSADEINILFVNYKRLCSKTEALNLNDFRAMLSCTEGSVFIDGLFRLFDRNINGRIDFVEFATSLALYQNKARSIPDQDKQRLFFKIYDVDGDGEISQGDLRTILVSCFASNNMEVCTSDVDELVKATFMKYDLTSRGTIDIGSYSKHAFGHRSGYL